MNGTPNDHAPAEPFSRRSLRSLRPARASDLDAIWAIESAVFEGQAWSRDVMREELAAPHRHYLVLVDDADTVLGYGGLLAIADGAGGGDGDIQTIALDRSERGQGYGRLLMNALLDEAERREVTQVFLEVRADNPEARGLYTSLGFDEVGVRPRYYQPDDVDAIVMRLETENRK